MTLIVLINALSCGAFCSSRHCKLSLFIFKLTLMSSFSYLCRCTVLSSSFTLASATSSRPASCDYWFACWDWTENGDGIENRVRDVLGCNCCYGYWYGVFCDWSTGVLMLAYCLLCWVAWVLEAEAVVVGVSPPMKARLLLLVPPFMIKKSLK